MVKLIECGSGPYVLLEEVCCENCGPRVYNSFDEFPDFRMPFPLIVTTEFVRNLGRCGECGGQVRVATQTVAPEGCKFVDRWELGPFEDGGTVNVYEMIWPLSLADLA